MMKDEILKLIETTYVKKNFIDFTKRDYESHIKRLKIVIDSINQFFVDFYKTNFFNYSSFLKLEITDQTHNPIDFSNLNFYNDSVTHLNICLPYQCNVKGLLKVLLDFSELISLTLRFNFPSFLTFMEELKIENLKGFSSLNLEIICEVKEAKVVLNNTDTLNKMFQEFSRIKQNNEKALSCVNINLLLKNCEDDQSFFKSAKLHNILQNNFIKYLSKYSIFGLNIIIYDKQTNFTDETEKLKKQIDIKNHNKIEKLIINTGFILYVPLNVIEKEKNEINKYVDFETNPVIGINTFEQYKTEKTKNSVIFK